MQQFQGDSDDNEDDLKENKSSKRILQKQYFSIPKDENVRLFSMEELMLKLKEYEGAIKSVEQIYKSPTIGEEIILLDLRIGMKSFLEDKVFIAQPNILHNIRRGITLVKDKNATNILRKGLKKFFDMYVYFEKISDFDLLNQCQKQKTRDFGVDDLALFQYTFQPVFKALEQGHKIQISVQEKANGENAQISYYAPLDSWIICSKNVAMFCQNEEQMATEPRYNFTRLIATQWFEQIRNHPKIEKLKETLKNHTLVGEYCGDPNYQHVVVYEKIQLRFYALVNHSSMDTCVYPADGHKFIQEMGLICVKSQLYEINSFPELQTQVEAISKQVSIANLTDAGEGCVVYFSDMNEQRCLSLGKLKTIHYRLLRKIREKSKNLANHIQIQKILDIEYFETNLDKQVKKFVHEAEILKTQMGVEIQMEYFQKIAIRCFRSEQNYLRQTYFDAVKNNETIQITKQMNQNEITQAKKQNSKAQQEIDAQIAQAIMGIMNVLGSFYQELILLVEQDQDKDDVHIDSFRIVIEKHKEDQFLQQQEFIEEKYKKINQGRNYQLQQAAQPEKVKAKHQKQQQKKEKKEQRKLEKQKQKKEQEQEQEQEKEQEQEIK